MYLYNTISCVICKREISKNNFNKHFKSKGCLSQTTTKIGICPYCNLNTSVLPKGQAANHVRWCIKNPKHKQYVLDLKKVRFGGRLPGKSLEKMKQGISIAHKNGKYIGAPAKAIKTKIERGNLAHTEETKSRMSNSALLSDHQRVCKSSHKFIDKIGREFIFDSKWEDALAIRLDMLDIVWERPGPIKWIDKNNKERNYFPDFYIPSIDLYLDPKNSYVKDKQKEKLEILHKIINLLILDSIEKCSNITIEQLAATMGVEPTSIQLHS